MVAETPWKATIAMIRRRIYNPAHLTPEELKESFVAREDTLAELLRVIREQAAGRPCQHMMLIGPRGMGKTTLGLRFLHAIEEDSDLRERWQPVAFHEESYGIANLADFWIHALRHLTRATGKSRWEERAEALIKDEGDLERATAYALAELMDFSHESGKRLILFVENIDAVIGQIHDEREIHGLRATLIERPEILLLGSANAYFESIGGYGEPLYEFFRVFKLEGIGRQEARLILEAVASSEGRPEVSESLNMERGRLETIRRITGGNPRLLALACHLLIDSPLGSIVEDLERLIDEQTPYFKARIEDLPGQARKVFHCLSEGWKPLLAKEVAASVKLSSSHASAQLKQLVEKGYAREVQLPRSTRTRYEVSDRFYNIYYLLRFSRSGRQRLERLVEFLHDLFGPAVLTAPRTNGTGAGDVSEWLSVLTRQVAADQEFVGRDDWRKQAADIIVERFGPKSSLISEDWNNLFSALKSGALLGLNRLAEALSALEKVTVNPVSDDTTELSRITGGLASWLKGVLLIHLQQSDEAMACQIVVKYVRPDDPKWLLTIAAVTLTLSGRILIDLERYAEADEILREASEIDQEHAKSWIYRAQSILMQPNAKRFSEAAMFAERAVELNPDSRVALYTLADVLSRQGNWLEALDRLEQALRSDNGKPKERAGKEVVDSLIGAAAAGHGARVKRIMREAGLVESMEPLWHAVRAELGEDLEALPAEVMDAVLLLRRRIAGDSTAAGYSQG